LNKNTLAKALERKFGAFCSTIAEDLKKELHTPRFEEGFIGVTTVRQSGETVEETRNIVDTGELVNSQVLEVKGINATITYLAEHAPEVYYVDHGGRPWIERYIQETGEAGFRQKFIDS
jgi:hypothetical protein